jgi:hypothetical protein
LAQHQNAIAAQAITPARRDQLFRSIDTARKNRKRVLLLWEQTSEQRLKT